jgi:hypothetical protein
VDSQQEQRAIGTGKGLIPAAFVVMGIGVALLIQGGWGIVFGILAILCGILTLIFTRFGTKPWDDFTWYEYVVVAPTVLLAWLFYGSVLVTIWIIKFILDMIG